VKPILSYLVLIAGMTLLSPTDLSQAAAPSARYVTLHGVVHDTKTGLDWEQSPVLTQYNRADANAHCQGMTSTTPGTAWRVPTIKELLSLVDDRAISPSPTIDMATFPSTQTSDYWSSTRSNLGAPFDSVIWTVSFGNGATVLNSLDTPNRFYVRCVLGLLP